MGKARFVTRAFTEWIRRVLTHVEMPDVAGDEIAALVLEQFNRLPQKRKPAVRDNGIHEWVPMSGIVAEGTYMH